MFALLARTGHWSKVGSSVTSRSTPMSVKKNVASRSRALRFADRASLEHEGGK